MGHPLFLLAIATFLVIIAYLVWNKVSIERHKSPGKTSGIGGESDPLSGDTPGIRDADALRASLNEAADKPDLAPVGKTAGESRFTGSR